MQSMANALAHRGPDAQGIFMSANHQAALGHNRLSVIDLSSAANQPMVSADGRYVVVFNGEIYNFQKIRLELQQINGTIRFRTCSDTETILYAFAEWGSDIVHRIDGMFAIAIFDQVNNTLFLCRDRVGKKPIFYYRDENHFIFASEIKSLLLHPAVINSKEINTEALSHFLHLGYIPQPNTIFSNIFKFPAASWASVDNSFNLKPQSYWNIEHEVTKEKIRNPIQAKNELKEVLQKSIRKRLIGDVPLGAFLSGGTDSSLVTAIASRQLSVPLKTFAIGFAESKFDESIYARAVAKHLKTDHHEYVLSEKEGVDLIDTYLHHFDEPFADTSAIPTMIVSRLARKEVTVALTGDGGDELFQGYGSYRWTKRLSSLPWRAVRLPLQKLLSTFGSSRMERVSYLFSDHSLNLHSHIFSQEHYFFSQKEIKDELLLNTNRFHLFQYAPIKTEQNILPDEQQALFDFNYYLKDDLLVKVDRASMYYALECRCPLLDKELISFACSLDVSLKRQKGISKWLLKSLLTEYIPENLVYRAKWGFSIPLSRWLKNDLRYLLDEFLSEAQVEAVGLFKKEYVTKLKKDFLNGKDFLFNRLWAIVILQKWMKENQ